MFLARNHVIYQWFELERDPEASRLHGLFGEGAELPLVLLPDGSSLHGAETLELAAALGLRTTAESALYDLVVVGAGPAGLAAAVYGASEGLRTAVIERDAPGGQAAQSAGSRTTSASPRAERGVCRSGRRSRRAASAPR